LSVYSVKRLQEAWGVGLPVKAYFIQYWFMLPDSMKHSSYTYQKLFRALYGYTQSVYKASGKRYKYQRKGILSEIPYVKPGKNCVIIPPGSFKTLLAFFNTGANPTHNWRVKGDWKAKYFMNEKNIDDSKAITACENLITRSFVLSQNELQNTVGKELQSLNSKDPKSYDAAYASLVVAEAGKIVSNEWFKEVYLKSPKLKAFYESYKALK